MRILVVEDDALVAATLDMLFSSHSYAVDIATDGESAWQLIEAFDYDLLLLDVLLPKLDGISLCQRIRANNYLMPILLLTGQGESHQKATALNIGADDYVVKPFDPEELIARVQALLRRGSAVAQPVMEWGELRLTPSTRNVTYGDQPLTLTPKEYAILELFLRHNQQVLSSKALLEHAWTATENPGEETIRVHIKGLRKKLSSAGAPADFIETVYRVGYRLKPLESTASSESTAAQPASVATTAPTEVKETAVLVTADSALFLQAKALLADQMLNVVLINDEATVWDALKAGIPGVLILDASMSGLNSTKFCQALRQQPQWRSLPILVVLPSMEPELVTQVFAAGADDVVIKPIIGPELVARVKLRWPR